MHYIDVMTQSELLSVSAIGVRLCEDIDEKMYNYGQLQVRFKDGSVGWYEAGWGPMASNKAFFIKDVWVQRGLSQSLRNRRRWMAYLIVQACIHKLRKLG